MRALTGIVSVITFASLFAGGCATYEYEIVEPPQFAEHIGQKSDAVVTLDPLEYRLRSVDNRLVIRIYNHSGALITLLGARSTVVDPKGQSHPLRTQTIAPSSYVKLIIPPPPPQLPAYGPVFGVGVGTSVGDAAAVGGRYFEDPYFAAPVYAVYDPNDSYYWEWEGDDGGGTARLTLIYQPEPGSPNTATQPMAGPIRHEFVIRRVKM
jgi:hypothetical protein